MKSHRKTIFALDFNLIAKTSSQVWTEFLGQSENELDKLYHYIKNPMQKQFL